MDKYTLVNYFDVWQEGEEEEGNVWQVNNLCKERDIVLKDYTDYEEIIQVLQEIGFLNENANIDNIEFMNDYEMIEFYEKENMKPLGRLELKEFKETETKETMEEWENYGDASPLSHGGIFIKKDEENEKCFYVICNNMEFGYVSDLYVDLESDWINWEEVKDSMSTPDDVEDEYLVVDLIYYYNHAEFGYTIECTSLNDLIDELEKYGITFE